MERDAELCTRFVCWPIAVLIAASAIASCGGDETDGASKLRDASLADTLPTDDTLGADVGTDAQTADSGPASDVAPDAPMSALASVKLPVLVYPADGASEHTEAIEVHVDQPGQVDRLYVQAHQPFYHRGGVEQGRPDGFDPEGMASIRLNGGNWIEVRDENVDCAYPESQYGCVAGGYSTIRFTIPVDNARQGVNDIEFRYNGTKGVRSGYRVLEVDLRDANGQSVLTRTQFRDPDYGSWQPPIDNQQAIDEGKTLFQATDTLVENPITGDAMEASCSGCHATSGQDLAYFNYSNRSIVARSRFHGLTQREGEKIASYIRSIELKKRDGSTYQPPGTPWDPPYQPGPTLQATGQHPDQSNQVYWAAGAGLDWVLDHDEDMLKYMFPKDGDPQNGVDWQMVDGKKQLDWQRYVHHADSLNPREAPLAMQLPDWNNWLPDIHPRDAYQPEAFENGDAYDSLTQGRLRQAIDAYDDNLDSDQLRELDIAMKRVNLAFRQGGLNSADKLESSELSDHQRAEGLNSARRWKAVKFWEINHGLHIEDAAEARFGASPRDGFNDPRIWMGRRRTLFQIGPHVANVDGLNNKPFVYGSGGLDSFLTHQWYQLQVVVNAGSDPKSSGQTPVDWNYQTGFLEAPQGFGVPNGIRLFQTHIKRWQLMSNSQGLGSFNGGFPGGVWSPDQSRIYELNLMVDGFINNQGIWRNVDRDTMRALFEAALKSWQDYNSQFEVDEFPRGYDDFGNRRYRPSEYVPGTGDRVRRYSFADQFYFGLARSYQFLGLDRDVVVPIYEWAEQMWPNVDWMSQLDSGHAAIGDGAGLRVQYFDNNSLSATPVVDRVETDFHHDWQQGASPVGAISQGEYSIRWSGEFEPFFTEKLHFLIKTNRPTRMWVDGQQVLDMWDGGGNRIDNVVTDTLTKGTRHTIRIEMKSSVDVRRTRIELMWAGEKYFGNLGRLHANMFLPVQQLYPFASP